MKWTQWVVILGMVLMISGVAGADNPTKLAAGADHTCLQVNGKVFCWGYNNYGQLGNGTYVNAPTPVAVQGMQTASSLSAKVKHSCALLKGGGISCWGLNDYSKLTNPAVNMILYNNTPLPVAGIKDAVAVAEGGVHICALIDDGSVHCWGNNYYGQLGDGTKKTTSTPVPVNGVANAVGVAAGDNHTCAVIDDGSVQCWGNNYSGQLGDGTKYNPPTPVPVPVKGLANAVGVAAGHSHTCALIKDGSVLCWGLNDGGQLGDGTKYTALTPVPVNGVANAEAVATGLLHTCALIKDGSVKCWGNNYSGQLGDGTIDYSSTPVIVKYLTDAVAVAAGDHHSCALIKDGSVKCWGKNKYGQLGGETKYNSSTPVVVKLDPDAFQPASTPNMCSAADLTQAQQDAATCASELQDLKSKPSAACPFIQKIPLVVGNSFPENLYKRILYYANCN